MAKTTFDPDELDASAGKINKAAGQLDGIGSKVTSDANALAQDPWAGGLASQLPGIFTDLPSIKGDLQQTAKNIQSAVQEFELRTSGASQPAPNFGAAFSQLGSAVHNDVHHLDSWYKQHKKDIQTVLQDTATVAGVVSAVAGIVALLPIPGVDVVAETVSETAGLVDVGADAALLATGDDSTAVKADMAAGIFGIATGGVGEELGKGAKLLSEFRDAKGAVTAAADGVKTAEKAASDASDAAKLAKNASEAATHDANVAKFKSWIPVIGKHWEAAKNATAEVAEQAGTEAEEAQKAANQSQKVLDDAKESQVSADNALKEAKNPVSNVKKLISPRTESLFPPDLSAWHAGPLGKLEVGLSVSGAVLNVAGDSPLPDAVGKKIVGAS